MIYTLGEISGAHLNPAVTLGFWAARRLDKRHVLPYLAAQCAGRNCREFDIALFVPARYRIGPHFAGGRGVAIVGSGADFDCDFDVRNFGSFDGRQRKGHHSGFGHRRGCRVGSAVRRADLRRLDEPGALAGARSGFALFAEFVDLPVGANCGRFARRYDVPLRARRGLLRLIL